MHEATGFVMLVEYLDLILSILTLAVGLLILRQVMTSNWDVLTSRIFLKNDETQQAFKHFTQTFIAYTALMFISHTVTIMGIGSQTLIPDVLHLLSMLAMLGAAIILYNLFSHMDNVETGDEE